MNIKTTADYLDAAKEALGGISDYALAKRLGVSQPSISILRSGKRQPDNYVACTLAAILGIDPLEIIAAAELAREKDEKKREFWQGFWNQRFGKLAVCLALVGMLLGAANPSLQGASDAAAALLLWISLYIIYKAS